MTDASPSFPEGQISLGKKALKAIEDDPIITAIQLKKGHAKNLTTYLPHVSYPRVHPQYNILINSGRSSCRGSDNDKKSYSQYYKWEF